MRFLVLVSWSKGSLEGFAVLFATANDKVHLGLPLSIGIAFHNLAEGKVWFVCFANVDSPKVLLLLSK